MGPFYERREAGLVLLCIGAETLGLHAESRVPIEPPGARLLRQWIVFLAAGRLDTHAALSAYHAQAQPPYPLSILSQVENKNNPKHCYTNLHS